MRVLVVEDSERLRRSLEVGLRRSGFAVDLVADGEDGLAYARHGDYDVIVLDLMLPRLSGLELLRRLREGGSAAHVLILSARDQVEHRVQGLQTGADDYLTKPFSLEELVARIRALVRRKYRAKSPVHAVGDLHVDTARRTVARGDTDVRLTPREYAVVEYLVLRRGRVAGKQELLDHLHPVAADASPNSIEVLVHQIRRKLRDAGAAELIRTRRGHGYLID